MIFSCGWGWLCMVYRDPLQTNVSSLQKRRQNETSLVFERNSKYKLTVTQELCVSAKNNLPVTCGKAS
jgi:hypothetical protein